MSSLGLLATCCSADVPTTKAGHLQPSQAWMAEEQAFVGKILSSFRVDCIFFQLARTFAWLPIIWERGQPLLEILVVWVAMDS